MQKENKSGRNPHALYFDEPTLTVQSFKDECDINKIVSRALQGSDITHVNARVAQYGDFTNVPDFQQAQQLVIRANGMFMSLPAEVRERFANDPALMIKFLQDPKNRDEAVKLGLVNPPVAAPAAPGEPAAKAAATPSAAPKKGKAAPLSPAPDLTQDPDPE